MSNKLLLSSLVAIAAIGGVWWYAGQSVSDVTLIATPETAQETAATISSDSALAQAMFPAFQTNATNDNVQGTPTFLINGEGYSGSMPHADFAALLDAKLAT